MKVAIIGAGIAGLYLAWKLAEKDIQVVVFEKRKKVGKEVCSGLFSERILEYIPQGKELVQSSIDFCILNFPRRKIKLQFSKKFYVMDHSALDNLVLKLAESQGVKIVYGKTIDENSIEELKTEFDKIIGADGSNSLVRRSLKLPPPHFKLGIQGFIGGQDYSNWVDAWPTPNGFIWRIPRGKNIEWGIMEEESVAEDMFYRFLREKNINKNRMVIRSTIIPQGFVIPKNYNITLLGDAAGLTKPWSGGGVAWGLTAANLILKYFPDFIKYKKEAKKIFLSRIILSKLLMRVVYNFGTYFPYLMPKKVKVESDFLI